VNSWISGFELVLDFTLRTWILVAAEYHEAALGVEVMPRDRVSFLLNVITVMVGMVLLPAPTQAADAQQPLVFISAFAAGDDGAIHAFHLDLKTGQLEPVARTDDVEHPFFLALSPDQRFLYSIHASRFGGAEDEQVAAFEILGRSGRLKLLNRQSARGPAACYLDVDATGRAVLVANYSTGSVAALSAEEDGSLGEVSSFFQHAGSSVDPNRQNGPHAHCFVISPDNRFALAADLGLDQIRIYQLDVSTATLAPGQQPFARTPPGAGPRHLAFAPNGKYVYVINELSNSITLFDYDPATGMLTERQTVPTLPPEFERSSYCADLKITADGRFLYGTNRGHDSIAAYRIGQDGRLTLIAIEPSLGEGPQNLAIAPDGRLILCANMPGNNVAVFRIDTDTGRLTSVGPPVPITRPSCIRIVP
jgi:6-phosphogluconolactonase